MWLIDSMRATASIADEGKNPFPKIWMQIILFRHKLWYFCKCDHDMYTLHTHTRLPRVSFHWAIKRTAVFRFLCYCCYCFRSIFASLLACWFFSALLLVYTQTFRFRSIPLLIVWALLRVCAILIGRFCKQIKHYVYYTTRIRTLNVFRVVLFLCVRLFCIFMNGLMHYAVHLLVNSFFCSFISVVYTTNKLSRIGR